MAEFKEETKRKKEELKQLSGNLKEAGAIMGGFTEVANGLSKIRLNVVEEEHQNKLTSLKTNLDNGLITEEEYNKAVFDAEVSLVKKKNEIEKNAFMINKINDLVQIGINTAVGITKTGAQLGYPAAIPAVIALGVSGAIQAGVVMSKSFTPTPVPTAESGAYLNGSRHSQGGIPIIAEDGEMIINRKSVTRFAPELNQIQSYGRGEGDNTGGGMGIDYERLAATMQSKKVYLVSSEVTDAQSEDVLVNDRISF